MKAAPSFPFYPSDWLRDPGLRSCSLAARGLWIDMLAFMHEAEPYGHLRLQGRDISPEILARMVGSSLKVVRRLLAELETAGVFSRTDQGGLYSRRMVKDHALREKRGQYGHLSKNHPLVPQKRSEKDTVKDIAKDTFQPAFGGSPSSSFSSSSSFSERKQREARSTTSSPAAGITEKRSIKIADEDFIEGLKNNPAYAGIDIEREIGKCRAWLLTPKGRGKQLTRQRLVNWLNGIDVPLSGHSHSLTCTKRIRGQDDRFLRPCGQPASLESRLNEPRCAEHLQTMPNPESVTHGTH